MVDAVQVYVLSLDPPVLSSFRRLRSLAPSRQNVATRILECRLRAGCAVERPLSQNWLYSRSWPLCRALHNGHYAQCPIMCSGVRLSASSALWEAAGALLGLCIITGSSGSRAASRTRGSGGSWRPAPGGVPGRDPSSRDQLRRSGASSSDSHAQAIARSHCESPRLYRRAPGLSQAAIGN